MQQITLYLAYPQRKKCNDIEKNVENTNAVQNKKQQWN